MTEDGSSAAQDLQILHALQMAIALEQQVGKPKFVDLYITTVEQLIDRIWEKYWDASRRLFADTPDKEVFSPQANSLAIRSDCRAWGSSLNVEFFPNHYGD